MQKSFWNELGNRISLAVVYANNAVSISITGPTSMSENLLTLKEAQELNAALHLILSSVPR